MKQFILILEEASNLLQTPYDLLSDTSALLQVGSMPILIEYQVDSMSITMTAAIGALVGELPLPVYELILNANACDAELFGSKLGIDPKTKQIVLAHKLHSLINDGEKFAYNLRVYIEVAIFWQTALSHSVTGSESTGSVAASDHAAMLSV